MPKGRAFTSGARDLALRAILAAILCSTWIISLPAKGLDKPSKVWVPAVYHGLVMGQSTREDIVKVLGKPKWIGKEQDTGIPIIEYVVRDPIPGTLTVYFRGRSVDGMNLHPDQELTKKDIVHLLGTDYLSVRYALDDCMAEGDTAPICEAVDGPIEHMEYRDRGLAAILNDGKVESIAFVAKPSWSTHCRCTGQNAGRR